MLSCMGKACLRNGHPILTSSPHPSASLPNCPRLNPSTCPTTFLPFLFPPCAPSSCSILSVSPNPFRR
jgi:hypothetical protein